MMEKLIMTKEKDTTRKRSKVKGKMKVQQVTKQKDYKKVEPEESSRKNIKMNEYEKKIGISQF